MVALHDRKKKSELKKCMRSYEAFTLIYLHYCIYLIEECLLIIYIFSQLFGCEDQLEWIIFHDIIWTSKIFVRTVCPVSVNFFPCLSSLLYEEFTFKTEMCSLQDS